MENTNRQIAPRQEGRPDFPAEQHAYVPATDIIESEHALRLILDLPGVSDKGLNLEVKDNTLSIHGRVDERSSPKGRLSYQEYRQGDYRRVFTLADGLDVNKIEAVLKDGILTITLPKSERLKPRRIEIKSA
jgi:HSP20 family protein